jgi:hypothetical membrane protein
MNRPTRTLSAIAFLAGSIVYLVAETVTAAAWRSPAYDYATNWISDLGSATSGVFQGRELSSPLHAVMNSGFIVQGVLFGIGAVLLSRSITGRLRPTTAVMGVLVAIGYVLVGSFHGSLQAQQDGTLWLHFTGATLAILGGNLLAVLLGTRWTRTGATRHIGIISLALGAAGLIATVVLLLTFDADVPSGLIERVAVYAITAWQLIVAVGALVSRSRTSLSRVAA